METCGFIEKMRNRRLILASGSPRRRELLADLGVEFIVDVPEVDESHDESVAAEDVAPMLGCGLQAAAWYP